MAGSGWWLGGSRPARAARAALRVARPFRDYEDMILRFVTNLDVVNFTNNEVERTIRPVKVQIKQLGRLLAHPNSLAQFAIV
jgi:transposase